MIKSLALSLSHSLYPSLSIYLSVSSLSGCKIKQLLINCTRQNVITQISTELLGGQFLILNFSFTLYSIYCISFHGFDQYFIKSSVERNIECRIFKLFFNLLRNWWKYRAVVVAQLPTPEVRGSNPVIGKKLYLYHLFTVNCIEKTKIKKNESGNGPFAKTVGNISVQMDQWFNVRRMWMIGKSGLSKFYVPANELA